MESDHADAVPPPGEKPPAEPSPDAVPASGDTPSPTAASPPTASPAAGSRAQDIKAVLAGDDRASAGDRPDGDDVESGREPHVLLVHAVIKASREHDVWSASGGPRPQLPRTWTELWRNAVRRQTDLAGEPEEAARRSVQAMLDQLTRLDREAAWFRTDPALRDRAIAETLLYGTGLGPGVPSRPAQLAWDRQRGLRPVDYAKITAIAAAQDDWLAAWNEWALTR
ncbi:hypothetical protein Aph02nite_88290 [Actinoplanes philippinensis]|uniref:Uncharacterized protein n=1 Tax=Actinoplanes philippinensis TaxID=35752 RepID=A0A1I2M094_9ACTN|nr:hypothetical protein [Actinoplanes philippinensis]GIE82879.1 hypothetical protein Aph02nite_88290 [Actinoplanes philippinensis]SFF84248.1 hypothetical protein SAMN05421541_12522 [Actinoplanes philippinensis]